MILTATSTPQKFAEVFTQSTKISIQVRPSATGGPADPQINIAREQGEIANLGDGLTLSQSGTFPPAQPWSDWWKGELWYVIGPNQGNITAIPFVLEILTI